MTKITSVADAVGLIQHRDVIAVSGYGTNGVPEKILQAVGERFLATNEPRDLTIMFAGGIGDGAGRGLNHLGKEGLIARTIGGHYGLIPSFERLAVENKIKAYNFPEGVMTHLYRNIAAGKHGAMSHVGLETFVDPRIEGGKVNEAADEDLVRLLEIDGDEILYFKGFPVDVAIIRGTTADPDGNISLERESLNLENLSLAMAARNSGGEDRYHKKSRKRNPLSRSGLSLPLQLPHFVNLLLTRIVDKQKPPRRTAVSALIMLDFFGCGSRI
jgi:propionate CoA-transferase